MTTNLLLFNLFIDSNSFRRLIVMSISREEQWQCISSVIVECHERVPGGERSPVVVLITSSVAEVRIKVVDTYLTALEGIRGEAFCWNDPTNNW